MGRILSWLITLLRGWFTIKADIQQKQREHVGEVIQQNTYMRAEVARDEAALKADANAPRTKVDKLQALESGAE